MFVGKDVARDWFVILTSFESCQSCSLDAVGAIPFFQIFRALHDSTKKRDCNLLNGNRSLKKRQFFLANHSNFVPRRTVFFWKKDPKDKVEANLFGMRVSRSKMCISEVLKKSEAFAHHLLFLDGRFLHLGRIRKFPRDTHEKKPHKTKDWIGKCRLKVTNFQA